MEVMNIKKSRFGWFAQWVNDYHPDNPEFMQCVHWVALENKEQKHITFQYALDTQNKTRKVVGRIPFDGRGNFADTVKKWTERRDYGDMARYMVGQ